VGKLEYNGVACYYITIQLSQCVEETTTTWQVFSKCHGWPFNLHLISFNLDATNTNTLMMFVNDSPRKFANCCAKTVYMCNQPHVLLFAIKAIPTGTELRYDYGSIKIPWRQQVNIPSILSNGIMSITIFKLALHFIVITQIVIFNTIVGLSSMFHSWSLCRYFCTLLTAFTFILWVIMCTWDQVLLLYVFPISVLGGRRWCHR